MHTIRTAPLLLAALLSLALTSGCTIIRYVDPPEPDPPPTAGPPRIMDVLVMVEMDRSTVQLAEDYQFILSQLTVGLAQANVMVRKVGLAPMYRRSGEAVPLVYGLGDGNSEFSNYGEAIAFFALDDGQRYLRDQVLADGENLATIGMDLDQRAIYHPTTADTDATPYYTVPEHGFLIVQLTSSARGCAHGDEACRLDGVEPAQYFTRQAEGGVQWLELPGELKLGPDRVFFLQIATSEGISEDDFLDSCERRPSFDPVNLDYMEPSPVSYFQPFTDSVNERGGWASYLDMCEAMSPLSSVTAIARISAEIASRMPRTSINPNPVAPPDEITVPDLNNSGGGEKPPLEEEPRVRERVGE